MGTFRSKTLVSLAAALLLLTGCAGAGEAPPPTVTETVVAPQEPAEDGGSDAMPTEDVMPTPPNHDLALVDTEVDGLTSECQDWCTSTEPDRFVAVDWLTVEDGTTIYRILEGHDMPVRVVEVTAESAAWPKWESAISAYGDGPFYEASPLMMQVREIECDEGGRCLTSEHDLMFYDGVQLLYAVSGEEVTQVALLGTD